MTFNFYTPTKVKIGLNSLDNIPDIVENYGKNILLVTGKNSLKQNGKLDLIKNIFESKKLNLNIYNKVEGDPTVKSVDALTHFAKKINPDLILAIGGGSVIDSSKMAAVCLGQGSSCWDFFNTNERKAKKINNDVAPLVAVPTTAGTAAESTPFSVITHDESLVKKGTSSPYLYPKYSFIDPSLHISMSPKITAYTGLDAFGQSLEAYLSLNNNPFCDIIALESIRVIYNTLPDVFLDGTNIKGREKVAYGACLSGYAISHNETNLAHAIAFSLGAHLNLHHGLSVAVCTPPALKFNKNFCSDKLIEISRVLNLYNIKKSVSYNVDNLIENISNFIYNLDIPQNFKQLSSKNSNFDRILSDTINIGSIKTNVREVNIDKLSLVIEELI